MGYIQWSSMDTSLISSERRALGVFERHIFGGMLEHEVASRKMNHELAAAV